MCIILPCILRGFQQGQCGTSFYYVLKKGPLVARPVKDEQGENEIGGDQLGGHGRLCLFFFFNFLNTI